MVEVADTWVAVGMVGQTAAEAEVDNRVVSVVEVYLRRVVDHIVEVGNRVVAVAEVYLRRVVAP